MKCTKSPLYIRPEILEFAQSMEIEMQRKDLKGYTNTDKSITFLIDKLSEERDEVDECLITLSGGKWEINKLINQKQKEMDNEISVQRQHENEKFDVNEQLKKEWKIK